MKKVIFASAIMTALAAPAPAETLFKLNFDEAASGTFTSGTVYTAGGTEVVNPAAGGLGTAVLQFADSGAPDAANESQADGATIGAPPAGITGAGQGGKALLVDSGSGQDEGMRIFVDNGLSSQSFTMETIWFTNDVSGGANAGGIQTIIGDNWPMLNLFGPDPHEADFQIRAIGPDNIQYNGDYGSVVYANPGVNQSDRWYHDALVFTYNVGDPANSAIRGYRNGRRLGTATYNGANGQAVELFGPTNINGTNRYLTIGFNNSFEYRINDHRRGLNGGVDAVAISNEAFAPEQFVLPVEFDPVPEVHGGVNAAKVTYTTPGADMGLDRDSVRVPVTAGSILRLSMWMRNGGETESKIIRVTMAAFRQDGSFAGDTNYLAGLVVPEVWTQYSVNYTVPAEVTNLNLSFRAEANGSSIVLDDISVIDVATSAELITNGGFEEWPGEPDTTPPDWRFFAVGGAAGSVTRLSTASSTVDNWMLFE